VWLDRNDNGVQDAGEAGLPGATVTLVDSAGKQVGDPVVTGTDGVYRFDDLAPGDYRTRYTLPSGYQLGYRDQGGDESRDSDLDPADATARFDLAAGEARADVDGGLYRLGSVGNLAWVDANANGVQDAGEKGLAGVAVTLYDPAGKQVGSPATTSSAG